MTRTPDSPQTSEPLRIPRQDVSMLKARAQGLAVPRHRRLLGLTGSPGAGKSTLAEQVVDMLPGLAVLLPMDGFHLAQEQLVVLDKVATKGAIDTFDGAGFVHLLERIRGNEERTIYAPVFRRDLEEPIAGSIAIDPDVPLVVVEGNYLLATSGGWGRVRELLDEVWFVDPGEEARLSWLVARHMQFGRDRAAAEERAKGSDQVNADLVSGTRMRADVLVTGH